MDELAIANLGWKGILTVAALRYFVPWAKDKVATQRLELARKYAREAVRWVLSRVPAEKFLRARGALPAGGPYRDDHAEARAREWEELRAQLEEEAIRHMRFIATGAIKKWVEKDLRSSVRDVWREVEAELSYERAMALDVDAWSKRIDSIPTVEEQLDRMGATRIDPRTGAETTRFPPPPPPAKP